MPWKSVSFLHPRRVNGLVVFCLVSAEAVGEGEAGGGITGVFASHILTCPMVFGGDEDYNNIGVHCPHRDFRISVILALQPLRHSKAGDGDGC